MKVLLDTDLASAFANVGRMELLVRLIEGIELGRLFRFLSEAAAHAAERLRCHERT